MRSDRGEVLLALARASISEAFGGPKPVMPSGADWLEEQGAVFVTLTLDGQLRGCVGSAQAHRRLFDDVVDNAKAAAFDDPRFQPLTADELGRTRLEVSLLSPLEKVEVATEDELLRKLRPGVDGLQLQWGYHRGLFIPEMWHKLPDPRLFVKHLKHKAGLDPDGWHAGTRVHRFTAEAFAEHA